MDTEKTGRFIAALRKEAGYTQKELANRLSVTDKAVSRWETGKGLPEPSLLRPLAELLGVSVGELLSGERLADGEVKEQTDAVILDALRYSGRTAARAVNGLLIFLGVVLLAAPLYTTNIGPSRWLWIPGVLILLWAVFRILRGRRGKRLRLPDRTLYGISILSETLALILEILPVGAVMAFASPDGPRFSTFSFFSLVPVGYANFIPFLTGILTALALLLSVLSVLKWETSPRKRNAAFLSVLFAAVLFLLSPLVFAGSMNGFSYAVLALLLLSMILQAVANRKAA